MQKKHLASASWIAAVMFAAAGLIMPPMGVIDGSVLILVAQLLIACATFLGVDNYFNIVGTRKK